MAYRITKNAFSASAALIASMALAACSTGFDPTFGIGVPAPQTAALATTDTLNAPSPGSVEVAPLAPQSATGKLTADDLFLSAHYAARTVDGIAIPAIDRSRIAREHLRAEVAYGGPEAPGSIVIDTTKRHLYLVQENGRAIRYGIAVGREGFGWKGTERLTRLAKWPTWTPPASMIEREPELEKWAAGMPGSAENPLGARALYLGNTLYRIHGSNKPYSIGKAASSGCFRMINQDVLDLYERVKPGAMVYVRDRSPVLVASN